MDEIDDDVLFFFWFPILNGGKSVVEKTLHSLVGFGMFVGVQWVYYNMLPHERNVMWCRNGRTPFRFLFVGDDWEHRYSEGDRQLLEVHTGTHTMFKRHDIGKQLGTEDYDDDDDDVDDVDDDDGDDDDDDDDDDDVDDVDDDDDDDDDGGDDDDDDDDGDGDGDDDGDGDGDDDDDDDDDDAFSD